MPGPIPDGFHTITPFLNIVGAADAIAFFVKAFGAEIVQRVDMPDGKVGHADLKIGTSHVFVEEAVRNPPTQSSLLLYVDDVDAWWKRATDAGARVMVPLADRFWGDRWGMLADHWGNRWGIATHLEDVSPDELRGRTAAARPAP